jgi:hypothetical protein
MAIIPCFDKLIKPLATHPFFDLVQFWVRTPLDRDTIDWLKTLCGSIHHYEGPAPYSARFRQRLQLTQPSDLALQWLAERDDALINRAEIALDWVFKYRTDSDEVWRFLHRHFVRRWHGIKQEIRVYRPKAQAAPGDVGDETSGTRYDGGRRAPNRIAWYEEYHSRITGELNCLHFEWRLNSLKAVRRVGIESGNDLIGFDHRQFWQSRLLLFTADQERLGRLITNRANGKRGRISRIKQPDAYWINRRTGGHYLRTRDTIQELIDEFGRSHRIQRALVPISNEVLLPA